MELTQRMTSSWDKGMKIFSSLENNYKNDPERIKDIGVAKALGIQLRSGYNIMNFYFLREKMFRMEGRDRLKILKQLKNIIHEELDLNKQLLELCEKDSRLGFHSEAEGYKYFPGKILWRMEELKKVIKNDIPLVKKVIKNNELLFPEYTGKSPEGATATCITATNLSRSDKAPDLPAGLQWQEMPFGTGKTGLQWASNKDSEAIYIWIRDNSAVDQNPSSKEISGLRVKIEAQRLYPAKHFSFIKGFANITDDPVRDLGYALLYRAGLTEIHKDGKNYIVGRIPFRIIGVNAEKSDPIRIDVTAQMQGSGTNSWRPNNPVTGRLILGSDNPADLGWLLFE